ncbi:MAG: Ig-like domain repeat protein [Acidobacteriia bacterium]|nr:Ig-like domain repeat protein [Terriglobia bacterium]
MRPHCSPAFCFLASLIACLFVVSGALLAQQPAVRVTQAVDNSVRTVLRGNVHPLASAQFDRGEAPSNLALNRMLLVLKRSDQQEAALRRLIENQQYKKSPDYHRWLTPEQFGARFGPADSDIAAVTNWLQASGFQVAQVSKGRTVIEFSGTAGLVKQAFGTAIHKFVVKGEEHWANVSNPSIPTALAPVVAGVNSLHNFLKKPQNRFAGTFSKDRKTGQVKPVNPQFTFPGGCFPVGQDCNAVGPYDFATIYDVLPLWNAGTNGTGQTIAIVGRTNVNPQDATDFWNLFGLTVPANKVNIILNGPDPGINGDEGEADIDIQWSGAVAPGAIIDFVTSASTETTDGVDLSALYIVDNNLAPVMSESYGLCEALLPAGIVQFYGLLWEQAAAQGISAMVSTGDNGAAGCDPPSFFNAAQNGLQVNGLASTPFNVAVGGTDFDQYNVWSTYWNPTNDSHQASARSYIPENAWNDSCTNNFFVVFGGFGATPEAVCNNSTILNDGFVDIIGGSGGQSAVWAKPPWQTGTPNDITRDLPDISLFASDGFMGSFYIVCQADTSPSGTCDLNSPYNDFAGYGGTSVASPAFAGIMALVNQKWGPQGNPNFVLYKLPAQQANAFHDTPTGSTIAMPCFTGSTDCHTSTSGDSFGILSGVSTTTGYDLATGLGSVDAANMVNNWNNVTFTPSTTTLTLNSGNPVNVTHGVLVPVVVTVTPASPAATGEVSLLVNPGTPGATPPNPAIDWNTLTNGTKSWSTNLLPGGTYKVIAHYEGDTTYGGSYSSPSANVTVNPEASFVYMPGVVIGTDVTGAPLYSNTVVYGTGGGSSYLLRADVQNAGQNFCTTSVLGEIACPTGTVTFKDNGSPLDGGAFKLNSFGYTEDTGIQLTAGSHTLAANYGGDPSYNPSTTSTNITVTKAPATISNVSAPAAAAPGQSFPVTATVTTTSFGVAPTGTVTFLANGSPLAGSVQLTPVNGGSSNSASLGASLNSSISTPGNYNITATYSGDSNYGNVSTSNSAPIIVADFTVPASLVDPPAANPGQTTSTSMLITPVSTTQFTASVTYTCSGLPAGATCSFSPTGINATDLTTTVTVTVQTAGPFTGAAAAGARHKLRGEKQRLWLPLSLPLAGMVLVGLAGRRLPRRYKIAGLCLALAVTGFLLACGGGGSAPVSVSVSPASANLYPSMAGAPVQTKQFTATVSNSTNNSVTWAVAGGSANGTVDANGLYTAPAVLPASSSATVTATSAADTTKSGSATVHFLTPTPSGTGQITVTVTEGTTLVHTTAFNLTVN